MALEIAVDVGGTFTDVVLSDGEGRLGIFKSPTTAGHIVDGILDGLGLLAHHLGTTVGDVLGRCEAFSCGTTAATNAILEGAYARTALLCTEGFRDTLLIREGGKEDTYSIKIDYPPPYIPRRLTFGIRERIDAEGGVVVPLDEDQARQVLAEVRAAGVEAIAVCLLWSIANPVHERRLAALLDEACPGIPYSLSHRTMPSIREYRRTSATAIDASLKPLARRNIEELETRLRQAGLKGVLTLVTSSGGRTAGAEAVDRPIVLCLSGPSAAPEAGRHVGRAEALDPGNAIVVDMGGTSFDVSIVTGWDIPLHREGTIAGHHFGVPSVAVKTIGAGGGSIARVDDAGFIHVGPHSAGAVPGPACYGRGGARATVTDANLVRGFLNPDTFAGGTMRLAPELARAAVGRDVAEPLGMSLDEAAALVALTVEQNMVAAIEDVTVRRGIDPREYAMVVGGAAAGLHAVPIARELGISRLVAPRTAGVLSAFGILVSDITSGFGRSFVTDSRRFDHDGANRVLGELKAEATAYLDRMAVPQAARELRFSVEARYRGQVWQLTLPLAEPRIADAAALAAVLDDFHALHEKRYFVRSAGDPVEFVEWNVQAVGRLPSPPVVWPGNGAKNVSEALTAKRRAFLRECGGPVDISVYDGARLPAGGEVEGPAVIEMPLTALVLYPDTSARMSDAGNLLVTLQ